MGKAIVKPLSSIIEKYKYFWIDLNSLTVTESLHILLLSSHGYHFNGISYCWAFFQNDWKIEIFLNWFEHSRSHPGRDVCIMKFLPKLHNFWYELILDSKIAIAWRNMLKRNHLWLFVFVWYMPFIYIYCICREEKKLIFRFYHDLYMSV